MCAWRWARDPAFLLCLSFLHRPELSQISCMNRGVLNCLKLSNFIYFSSYFLWLTVTTADLDGDQVLYFYWIDPTEAAKRFISKPFFLGNSTQNMSGRTVWRPGNRAFGMANSGLIFQSAQYVDRFSSPLLLLFCADRSYSGKQRSHHRIYSKLLISC